MNNTCLYHHGVKGMKWGVRKDRVSNGFSNREQRSIAKSLRKGTDKVSKNKKLNNYLSENISNYEKAHKEWSSAADKADALASKTYNSRVNSAIVDINKNREKYGVNKNSTPNNRDFQKAIDYLTFDGKYSLDKSQEYKNEEKAFNNVKVEGDKLVNSILGKYGSKKAYTIKQTNSTLTAKQALESYIDNTYIYKKK